VLNPDDIKPTLFRVIRAQNDKFKSHEVTLWNPTITNSIT
jgi:hypothetical protein